jgi:hypothetical protein
VKGFHGLALKAHHHTKIITTVMAITTAMVVMKTLQILSDFKKPDRRWPIVVQNRHTARFMPANVMNMRMASPMGDRPPPKPA